MPVPGTIHGETIGMTRDKSNNPIPEENATGYPISFPIGNGLPEF
ncbi:MAG: hypothetical protein CM1200mP18_19560 [Gammaproteobacteria bacterium]|nr:MAG: hypothetical protein CM1200mP18_19560 [Gammaproteobacteria bacterium]